MTVFFEFLYNKNIDMLNLFKYTKHFAQICKKKKSNNNIFESNKISLNSLYNYDLYYLLDFYI